MQTTKQFSPASIPTLLLVLVSVVGACYAGTTTGLVLQAIHEFPSTPRMPYYGLIQARDGDLYGTALETGPDNPGTIYRLTTNGGLTTLYSFPTTNAPGGAGANDALVQGSDGNLYGTASGLGKPQFDFGMVFKLSTNGVFTPLYAFVPGSSGARPKGPLIQGRDGALYGTAYGGGASGFGAVFKVTIDGVFTTLSSFNGTNGAYPGAGVIQGLDGSLYGPASGGTNDAGVIFKLTPSGVLSALHSFRGSDGEYPETALVQGGDGFLYGTTRTGGANPLSLGTVFKVSTNGAFILLHSFGGTDGASPQGLVSGGDGNFYGTTADGGANRWFGTFFRITSSGVLTTLRSFDLADGDYPYGRLAGTSSAGFYGIMTGSGAYSSGSAPFYSVATAFRVLTNGNLTRLHSFADPEGRLPRGFVQAANGDFYGTLSGGGVNELGAVYRMTSTGVVSVLHAFKGSDGVSPQAGLVQGIAGNFYGTTAWGGVNDRGTVFKVTPEGALSTLHSFNDTDGNSPTARLTQGSDGLLYGTAYSGGRNGLGVVFKITTTGVLTTLASFDGTNGAFPSNPLVQGNDGNFYGAVAASATGGRDNVFRITPTGSLTTLVSFNGANGSDPRGLTLGSDGNFYGITFAGGAAGQGTIFKMTPGGALTTLVSFAGANGSHPQGCLLRGMDGNFYGSTLAAGANGAGTLFMITAEGVLTTLLSFDSNRPDTGNFLVQGQDGNIYGSFPTGVMGTGGTLFRLVRPPVLTVFRATTGGVMLSWKSFTNGVYRLQYNSTLADSNWIALTPDVTATSETTTLTDQLEGYSPRYYRIGLLP